MVSDREHRFEVRLRARAKLKRTPEDEALIVMKEGGMTQDEIARKAGISRSLVAKRLAEMGYDEKLPPWTTSKRVKQSLALSRKVQRCQDMWWSGDSVEEIAKALGCSVSTVYDWARRGTK